MEDIYREIHSYNGCQSSFSINLNLSFTSFVGICQPSVIALFSLQFYDFEVFTIFIGKSAVLPKVSFTFPPPSQIFTPRYIICRTRDFPVHSFIFFICIAINIVICRPCRTSKTLFHLIRLWSQIALHQMELSSFWVLLLPHNKNHTKLFFEIYSGTQCSMDIQQTMGALATDEKYFIS